MISLQNNIVLPYSLNRRSFYLATSEPLLDLVDSFPMFHQILDLTFVDMPFFYFLIGIVLDFDHSSVLYLT